MENQLDGNSGIAFTIETGADPGISAFTGFFCTYAFTPENIGNDAYAILAESLEETPHEGAMVVPDMGKLFADIGLRVYQVYPDGSQRDVTDLMIDAGFDVSKEADGEITMYWGALVADRDASDASYGMPVTLSSVGEDGHILFDGRMDDSIEGRFYIARGKQSPSNGGGCDTGTLGLSAVAIAAACLALVPVAGKKRK